LAVAKLSAGEFKFARPPAYNPALHPLEEIPVFVVIFRSKIRTLDDEYSQVAARMRELALNEFGCLDFQSVTEGQEEVALSYWPDQESIRAWKSHAEHIVAQQLGRERWYESYIVQVAEITREYRVNC
jgi:heme-degrading monooxygenase HmoA